MAQRFQPALAPGEREILHEQGAYTSGRSWKLGQFCLTDRRLLFGHMHRQFLEIDLGRVEDMRVQKKAFILASKPCLLLTYGDGAGGKPRDAWIANAHIEEWRRAITHLLAERGVEIRQDLSDAIEEVSGPGPRDPRERGRLVQPVRHKTSVPGLYAGEDPRAAGPAMPMGRRDAAQARRERLRALVVADHGGNGPGRLRPQDIAEVARFVDRGSAKMLWHFWKDRHYKLDDLRGLLGETSHMHVLARIREVINPTAVLILGRPLLVFERSRIDYESGEHVLHSWWLNEAPLVDTGDSHEPVDVLDEGDHFLVVVEIPGAHEPDIRVEANGGRLSVAVDGGESQRYQEVSLPAGADASNLAATYSNGILQVRLGKRAA